MKALRPHERQYIDDLRLKTELELSAEAKRHCADYHERLLNLYLPLEDSYLHCWQTMTKKLPGQKSKLPLEAIAYVFLSALILYSAYIAFNPGNSLTARYTAGACIAAFSVLIAGIQSFGQTLINNRYKNVAPQLQWYSEAYAIGVTDQSIFLVSYDDLDGSLKTTDLIPEIVQKIEILPSKRDKNESFLQIQFGSNEDSVVLQEKNSNAKKALQNIEFYNNKFLKEKNKKKDKTLMEKNDFKNINDFEYDLVKKAVNDEKVEILTIFSKKPHDEVYLPDAQNYAKIWNDNIDRVNAMPKYNSYMRYFFAAAGLFLLFGPFFLFTQNNGGTQDWTRHIVSFVAAGFAFFVAAYDTKLTYENRKKFRYNMILQDAFGNNAIALLGDTLFTLSVDDDLDEIKITDLQSINYAPDAESNHLILITKDNESYTYDDLKGPNGKTIPDLIKELLKHAS